MRLFVSYALLLSSLLASVYGQNSIQLPVVSSDGSVTTTISLALPDVRAPLKPSHLPQNSQIKQADSRVKAAIVATDTQAKQLYLKIQANTTSDQEKANLYLQLQNLKSRMQSLLALHLRLQSLRDQLVPEWATASNACPANWENLGFSFKERRVYCRPKKGGVPPGNPLCHRIFRFTETYNRCGFAEKCQVDWSSFNCPPSATQVQPLANSTGVTPAVPVPKWIVDTQLKFSRAKNSIVATFRVRVRRSYRHALANYRLATRRYARSQSLAARQRAKLFIKVAKAQVRVAQAYKAFQSARTPQSRQQALAIIVAAQRKAFHTASSAVTKQLQRARQAFTKAKTAEQRRAARYAVLRALVARAELTRTARLHQQLLHASSKSEFNGAIRQLLHAQKRLNSAVRKAFTKTTPFKVPKQIARPLTELEELKQQVKALATGQQQLKEMLTKLTDARTKLQHKAQTRLLSKQKQVNRIIASLEASKRTMSPQKRAKVSRLQKALRAVASLSIQATNATPRSIRATRVKAARLVRYLRHQVLFSSGALRQAAIRSLRAAIKAQRAIEIKAVEVKTKLAVARRLKTIIRSLKGQAKRSLDPIAKRKLLATISALQFQRTQILGPAATRGAPLRRYRVTLRGRGIRTSRAWWSNRSSSRFRRRRRSYARPYSAATRRRYQILRWSRRSRQLNNYINRLTARLEALRKRENASPKLIEKLEKKLQKLQAKKEKYTSKITAAREKQKLARMNRRLHSLDSRAFYLATKIAQLKAKGTSDANLAKIARLQNKLTQLKSKRTQLVAKRTMLRAQATKRTQRKLKMIKLRLQLLIKRLDQMASSSSANPKLVAKLAARIQRLRTKARKLKQKQIQMKRSRLKQRAKIVASAISRLEKTLESMKKSGASAAALAPIEARLDRYIHTLGKLKTTLRKTRPQVVRRSVAERSRLVKRALARAKKQLSILGPNADPKVIKQLRLKVLMLAAKRLELQQEKKESKKSQRAKNLRKLQQLVAEIHRLYDQLADLEDADAAPYAIMQLRRQIYNLKRIYYRLRAQLYPRKRNTVSEATLRRINRTIDRVESELESHSDADEPDQIEVDRLNRRLARLKAKRVAVRRALRQLRQEKISRARARVENVRRRINQVREQLEQTRQDPEGTEEELAKLQARLKRLQAKEAALFRRYTWLKAQARRSSRFRSGLSARVSTFGERKQRRRSPFLSRVINRKRRRTSLQARRRRQRRQANKLSRAAKRFWNLNHKRQSGKPKRRRHLKKKKNNKLSKEAKKFWNQSAKKRTGRQGKKRGNGGKVWWIEEESDEQRGNIPI